VQSVKYFLDWSGTADSGVLIKVESQLRAWKKNGLEVELIYVCNEQSRKEFKDISVKSFVHKGGLTRIKERWKANKYLVKTSGSSLVFRRYGLLLPFEISSFHKLNVVIELNTNNDFYYKQRGKIQYAWHSFQQSRVGREAIAACAVTGEIASIHRKIFKKIHVVTNGIEIPNTVNFSSNQKKDIKFIFLLGGDFNWNGLEIFEEIARNFPEWQFEVTGDVDYKPKLPNIKKNNYISVENIPQHLSEFSFGISSLNLDSVGLKEAAPLKNRSYLSNGLPIIARYPDSAFPPNSEEYFLMDFNDQQELINAGNLRKFIQKWCQEPITREHLRKIDIFEIELERIDFFNALIGVKKNHTRNGRMDLV
jgi:hypothetical protein